MKPHQHAYHAVLRAKNANILQPNAKNAYKEIFLDSMQPLIRLLNVLKNALLVHIQINNKTCAFLAKLLAIHAMKRLLNAFRAKVNINFLRRKINVSKIVLQEQWDYRALLNAQNAHHNVKNAMKHLNNAQVVKKGNTYLNNLNAQKLALKNIILILRHRNVTTLERMYFQYHSQLQEDY